MILRLIYTLLGVLMIGALIWTLGPLVSIGESKPLESAFSRWLTIGLVSLLLLSPLAILWVRQHRARRKLEAGLIEEDERIKEQENAIDRSFVDALKTLRKSRRKSSLLARFSSIYEQPWYAFIGPPGSGKTTALTNSGLHFPLQTDGKAQAIKGVGGTRNCDWWFTDEAILIDTAGRFSTQDSNRETDAAAWRKFLRLLKENRPRQPLNGVFLTLSTQDLLDDPLKLASLSVSLRHRLNEMNETLGMSLPVYIFVTKLDLLPGFTESFEPLSLDETRDGWGYALPRDIQGADILPNLLQGIEDLIQRLFEQMGTRLDHEHALERRHSIFAFPEHLERLLPPLKDLLNRVFDPASRYSSPDRLRGLYFTSGTQLHGTLARIAGGASATAPDGRAYFIENVLKKSVFKESHLTGAVKNRILLEKWSKIGLSVGAVTLLFFMLTGWWQSHGNNMNTMQTAGGNLQNIEQDIARLPRDRMLDVQPLFEMLNELEDITPLKSLDDTPPGWDHGLGLNQYEKLQFARNKTYERALQEQLLPRIAHRLEDQITESVGLDLEITYEGLKAYLMMHQPANRNLAEMTGWVKADWQNTLLGGMTQSDRDRALLHLGNALKLPIWTHLQPADDELIVKAREYLSRTSMSQRLYSRMKRFHGQSNPGRFNVLSRAGGDLSTIFVRSSGTSLNEGPPDFLTRQAFLGSFYPNLSEELQRLMKESSWVLDLESTAGGNDMASVSREVRLLYVRDYIDTWQAYLDDIKIRKTNTLQESVELARLLAMEQSPLRRFLQEVSEQTRLVGQLAKTGESIVDELSEEAQRRMPGRLSILSRIDLGDRSSTTVLEQQVDDHFRTINQLFEANGEGYRQMTMTLQTLYNQLAAVEASRRGQSLPPSSSEFDALSAQSGLMPEPIRSVVKSLSASAGSHSQAAHRASLTAELRPLRDACSKTISGRYPFDPQSSLDVLPDDFQRMFGPQGLLHTHLSTQLDPMIDKGGAIWKYKPSAGGGNQQSSSSLVQFQRAEEIRTVFFPSGSSAGFSFRMKLIGSSNQGDTFYMKHDGKLLMFSQQFDPQHSLVWSPSVDSNVEIRSSEDIAAVNYKGPWSLFRMFDKSIVKPAEGPERFISRIQLGQKWFEFEVTATTALNPLRLRALKTFRCPGAL